MKISDQNSLRITNQDSISVVHALSHFRNRDKMAGLKINQLIFFQGFAKIVSMFFRSSSQNSFFLLAKTLSFIVALYFVINAMHYSSNPEFTKVLQSLLGEPSTEGSEIKWCNRDNSQLLYNGNKKLILESQKVFLQLKDGSKKELNLPSSWPQELCHLRLESYPSQQGEENFFILFSITDTRVKVLELAPRSKTYRWEGLLFRSKTLDKSLQELEAALKNLENIRDS